MAKLIDSSVWIALYLDEDSQHTKAEQVFRTLGEKVYLPNLVLAEVASVLTYKHSKAQADRFVRFVMSHSDIEWVTSQPIDDAVYFLAIPSRLAFVDTSLLRLSKMLKADLITFDQQLARLYRKLIK
jgi:predicted nucleic acid-binding protein